MKQMTQFLDLRARVEGVEAFYEPEVSEDWRETGSLDITGPLYSRASSS